jgi:hypothetical protein
MVRSAARDRGDQADADRLLGIRERAATVSFLDAVPLAPVRWEADVMTPHYAGWEAGGDGSALPGDWRSPTPVPFLVAAPDTALLVAIIPRLRPAEGDRRLVRAWLQEAFEVAGAGAKTAVGYGRFRRDVERAQRAHGDMAERERVAREKRQREMAMATPEGRWRLRVMESTEENVLELVRVHLDQEPLADPGERAGLAAAVKASGHLTAWKAGNKLDQRTQTGPKKLKQRARSVITALSEAGLTEE